MKDSVALRVNMLDVPAIIAEHTDDLKGPDSACVEERGAAYFVGDRHIRTGYKYSFNRILVFPNDGSKNRRALAIIVRNILVFAECHVKEFKIAFLVQLASPAGWCCERVHRFAREIRLRSIREEFIPDG